MAYGITERCVACGLCKDVCPVEAIREGSPIYHISENQCIDCGACAGECPCEAIVAGGVVSCVRQEVTGRPNYQQSETAAVLCEEHKQRNKTTMKYQLTKKHFRALLDEMNITHKIDSDGDFVAPLSADEDCRYDVRVIFCVENASVQSLAVANGLEIPDNKISEAMLFCNDWNKSTKGPKGYVDIKNKTFIAECVTWTDVEISDEFIKENIIRLSLGLSWSFYKEVAKQF